MVVDSSPFLATLVDATSDLRWQRATLPDRVVLTHAHHGHVGGLPQFDREVAAAGGLHVHCTPGLAAVLRENEPFQSLVDGGYVTLRPFSDGDRLSVGDGSGDDSAAGDDGSAAGDGPAGGDGHLEARAVEHRDELGTGTLSLHVEGPDRSLYYVPDVDGLTAGVRAAVRGADVALVDATFWSADERAGYESVPHSTGRAVMETFEDSETEVYLTHLNHTNPLLDGESVEREKVQEAGLEVAERGQTFALE